MSLEAPVFIFGAGKADVTTLHDPTALLAVSVLSVVGLGVFQRLTSNGDSRQSEEH